MPHGAVEPPNPVFDYEIRHVRGLRTAHDLRRYAKVVLLAVLVAIVGLAVVLRLAYGTRTAGQVNFYGNYYLMIVFANVGLSVASDLINVLLTVLRVNRDVTASQWDVLRLTNLGETKILQAHYAVAQIRAWRLLPVEMAFRVLAVVLFPLFVVLETSLRSQFGVMTVLSFVVLGGFVSVFMLFGRGLFSLLCILEPIWRMQALVALGVAVAMQFRNLNSAISVGLCAILVLRVAQIGLLGLIGLGAAFLLSLTGRTSMIFPALVLIAFVGLATFAYGGFGLYSAFQRAALSRARRAAFQAD